MSGIWVVFGTRPEAIKLVPVIEALRRHGMPTRICVTAQHRDLLDQVLTGSGIRPDIDLDLMEPGQSLGALVGRMVGSLERLFTAERPHRVIVQGDTATAFASAQAAFLTDAPLAHVEAGLRTGDLGQPWPEEGFRRAIATWADLHFAPTSGAADALHAEGVPDRIIHITGNTIVDAFDAERRRGAPHCETVRSLIERAGRRRLVLVTCHRRESIGAGLTAITRALLELAQRPDVFLVVPVHPNPEVRAPITQALDSADGIALMPPLPFSPFLQLLRAAHFTITDSGGVQEEAPLVGTPVLIARDRTERVEGVSQGTAMLVGTDQARIVRESVRLLDEPLHHARMARVHRPYGDGHAADRIAAIIARQDALPAATALGE